MYRLFTFLQACYTYLLNCFLYRIGRTNASINTENPIEVSQFPYIPEKRLIVYKQNKDTIKFYDGKNYWDGTKNDFKEMYSSCIIISTQKKDITLEDAYLETKTGFDDILTLTKRKVNIYKSGTIAKASLKLFQETTLGPLHSLKLSPLEQEWIKYSSMGSIMFAEQYEGPAEEYDFVCLYPSLMVKKDVMWPKCRGEFKVINLNDYGKSFPYGVYKATIMGSHKAFRFNPKDLYTHFDLELALTLGLEINMLNSGEYNALIFSKSSLISGKQMFEEWAEYLFNIKCKGGPTGKVAKSMLVSLWGALSEQRNGNAFGSHFRIKPFILALARKTIIELTHPLGDKVKRIHTDGFIVTEKVNLPTNSLILGGLKLEKQGNVKIKNVNNISWSDIITVTINQQKAPEALNDPSKKNQGYVPKEMSLTINNHYIPNEILSHIMGYLYYSPKQSYLYPLLFINHQWNVCCSHILWRDITLSSVSLPRVANYFTMNKTCINAKYTKSLTLEESSYSPLKLDIIDLCLACKNLERLVFINTYRTINNHILKMIAEKCKLKEIIIYVSKNRITVSSIKELPKLCPTLKKVYIANLSDKFKEIKKYYASTYPHIDAQFYLKKDED
jgi:hypothetical protein